MNKGTMSKINKYYTEDKLKSDHLFDSNEINIHSDGLIRPYLAINCKI